LVSVLGFFLFLNIVSCLEIKVTIYESDDLFHCAFLTLVFLLTTLW